MTTTEPTQPLTDAELQRTILARRRGAVQSLNGCDCMQPDSHGIVLDSLGDVPRLLAEVDRLRAALTAMSRNERAAANRALTLQDENSALLRKLEDQYRHRAQRAQRANEVTRLRSENTAARELHKPVRTRWKYDHCANGCGAGAMMGPDRWPCDTAKALGLDQSGEVRANG
jgi:hypothetical protein